MYNCYNEAIEYLIKKYGEKLTPLSKLNSKMARTYCTDKEMSHDDKEVSLLIGQYYLGEAPKKELYYKLISLGAIKETIEA